MEEDHITGLANAIEADDDDAARRHLVGALSQMLGALNSIALSLDKIAHPAQVQVSGGVNLEEVNGRLA